MKQIYDELARRTGAGETVATATVMRTRGSTPREVGAKLLVSATGLVGTIGGGYPEGEAHGASLEAITEGEARLVEVDLTEQITYDANCVGGGVMHMLIEPWSDAVEAGRIWRALATPGRVGVVTSIDRDGERVATSHVVVTASGELAGGPDSGWLTADRIAEARAAVAAGQVGMIGSKRRVFAVHKLLYELGVPTEWLQRIHSPIGIDIGAETPAEIAVSIVAEAVRVRNGGGAPLLSDGVRERYAELVAKGQELE